MSDQFYYPNCRITDTTDFFSGKLHTLVINHDNQEYYFDDLFLFVLLNINSPEKDSETITKFRCTRQELHEIKDLIFETGLVTSKKKKKLKIGFLTERMSLGFGVDLVVHQTAKGLKENYNHEVVVYAGKVEELYKSPGYKIVSLENELKIGSDTFSQRYHSVTVPYLNSEKVDLWIVETPPFYYWKDQLNAPIIFVEHGTPHGHFFPRKTRIIVESAIWTKKILIFEQLRTFDRIVTVSEFLKNELTENARAKTHVIYNGSDHYPIAKKEEIRKFRKSLGLTENDFVLLTVTRIDLDESKSPYKGINELVEIFRIIKDKNQSIKLIIAGRGDESSKIDLEKQGIITLLNVTPSSMPLVYSSCDLYVSTSKWEGFNLPIAESQFSGKPVIAYNLCAHPELIISGKTGFLVGTKNEFCNKIIELSTDRELLKKLGINAIENSSKFSWSKSVEMLNDLIDSLIFKDSFKVNYEEKRYRARFLKMYFNISLNILKTEGFSGLVIILFYEMTKRMKDLFHDKKSR
jgi:glycosyltransferase involved in cell wall biosynthesis